MQAGWLSWLRRPRGLAASRTTNLPCWIFLVLPPELAPKELLRAEPLLPELRWLQRPAKNRARAPARGACFVPRRPGALCGIPESVALAAPRLGFPLPRPRFFRAMRPRWPPPRHLRQTAPPAKALWWPSASPSCFLGTQPLR